MDVESAINLFFKGVLLFPIFLLAGYIGVAMMKHMIFHGVPVMNTVTPEQREILKERDSQVGLPVSPVEERGEVVKEGVVTQSPLPVTPEVVVKEPLTVSQYDKFWNCMDKESGGRECERFIVGGRVINKRN